MITQTYNLDLVPNGITTVVSASQYDNTRTLVFKLYENGVAFDTSGASSAVITGRKPDNCFFMAPMTVGQGEVSVDLATQMTACAGNTTCEIVLYDSEGNQLGSTNFILNVEKAPVDDSSTISQSDISAIVSALSDSQRYANSAQAAAQSANSTAATLESLVPATSGNVGDVLVRDVDGSDWQTMTADLVSYDNSTSGLTATKVQGATDELVTRINNLSATNIAYSTASSGLDAVNTQEAIDKLANSRDLRVIVTRDSDTNTYSADHTYDEIRANFSAKGMPYVRYGGATFHLYMINTTAATFLFVNLGFAIVGDFNYGDVVQITVGANGNITFLNWGNSTFIAAPPDIVGVTISANAQNSVVNNSKIGDPAHSTVEVLPKPNYTSAQAITFANAKFVPYEHTTGSVKIYATGTAPTEAFPVDIRITSHK